MNNWTHDEDKDLLTNLHNNISIDNIATKLNKSVKDVNLHLGFIINNAINNGKTLTILSKKLNLDENILIELKHNYDTNIQQPKEINFNQPNEDESIKTDKKNKTNKTDKKDKTIKYSKNELQIILDKIKDENEILEEIIKNKEYHKRIQEMIKEGNLNENVFKIVNMLNL